jgi:flagellar protein FliJ
LKKFQFRLERLLSIKKHQEKEAKIKFAVQLQKKMKLVNQNEQFRQFIMDSLLEKDLSEYDEHQIDQSLLHLKDEYVKSLSKKMVDNTLQYEAMDNILNQLKNELTEAMVERKMLDELKKKKFKKYLKEQKREEINKLDDIAGLLKTRQK